jgi:hypothetical protein
VGSLNRFWDDISTGYERHVVDEGHQSAMLLLVAFLLTFVTVRFITHMIRDGKWKKVLRNVSTGGGTHLHHLVPGILLLLATGCLGIGFPTVLSRDILAILFGVGAALTLDEFALWLHLEDVYWSREGRQSVDAVVISATIVAMGIFGWQFVRDIATAVGRLLGIVQ